MRGKGIGSPAKLVQMRITPAYAGKRYKTLCDMEAMMDHPRLCGEKNPKLIIITTEGGSPPPMRGKVSSYAGKVTAETDHPRLCGEKRLRDV